MHRTTALRMVLLGVGALSASLARADEDVGAVAGFDPGHGFYLESGDGAWRLRPGLAAAYKFEPRYLDGQSQNRDTIYAVRPSLGGTVVRRWIRFLTEAELAQNPPYLLYSYIEIQPVAALGLRIGQQNTLFSRHENHGFTRILFPDTDPVADYFWTGRDKGVEAFGDLASARVSYHAGLYAGSPLRQFTTIAGNYVVEGRLALNPLGAPRDAEYAYVLGDDAAPLRISFAVQGYYGRVQFATENFNPNTFKFETQPTGMTTTEGAGGADVLLQSRLVVLLAEGYGRRTTPAGAARYTSFGVWGQVGVLIWPRHLDASVRVSWADPSTTLSSDRFLSGEAQVAWYVSVPTLIVKLRYGIGDQQSPGSAQLGDVVLPATPGRVQLATLQVNLVL